MTEEIGARRSDRPGDPLRMVAMASIGVLGLVALGTYAVRSDPRPAVDQPSSAPTTAPATAAPPRPSADVIASAEANVRAEPGVVDMVYDPDSVVTWTIAMKDDGGSRVGRAEAFCLQLAEWGVPRESTIVRIVDARRVLIEHEDYRSADLGTVKCSTGAVFGR